MSLILTLSPVPLKIQIFVKVFKEISNINLLNDGPWQDDSYYFMHA